MRGITHATARFLLTDRETVLMSTLRDGPTETAIWGRGPQNSLVMVLKTIVTWWIKQYEQGAATEE